VVAVEADGADAGVVADAGPLGEEERKVCFIFLLFLLKKSCYERFDNEISKKKLVPRK
jgi:hypothetical protein